MAESSFPEKNKSTQSQLAQLCQMRNKVEQKQQILLSKSISLARFIRIAALDHIRDLPEMDNAKKLLAMTLPEFGRNGKTPQRYHAAISRVLASFLRNLN